MVSSRFQPIIQRQTAEIEVWRGQMHLDGQMYLNQQSAVQGRREVVSAGCSNYLYLSGLFALSSGATLTIFGWPRQRCQSRSFRVGGYRVGVYRIYSLEAASTRWCRCCRCVAHKKSDKFQGDALPLQLGMAFCGVLLLRLVKRSC